MNETKSQPLAVTDKTFAEAVIQSDQPVLVDFWAEWCGPCRTLGPIVETVAGQNPDTLEVFKVNVDDHPELAQRYEIRGIPTLLLFQDGTLIERIVGVQPAAAIQAIVEDHMALA